MTTQIAVCDDDLPFAGVLENLLHTVQMEFNSVFDIEVFSSGEELLEKLNHGAYFSIVFLDIEMGGVSGIDVGQHIRKAGADTDTVIIYVSNHEQYHLELYPNRPIAFIRKPPDILSLRKALTLAFSELQKNKTIFSYQTSSRIVYVRKADIYFFESKGKKIHIVMHHGDDYFTMALEKLAVLLADDPSFTSVHRAFIANLSPVITFTRTELIYPDGYKIQVSAKRGKIVRIALLRYIKENDIPSNVGQ